MAMSRRWVGIAISVTPYIFLLPLPALRVRSISPLQIGETVKAMDMASGEECEREMFVKTTWGKRNLAVPL